MAPGYFRKIVLGYIPGNGLLKIFISQRNRERIYKYKFSNVLEERCGEVALGVVKLKGMIRRS